PRSTPGSRAGTRSRYGDRGPRPGSSSSRPCCSKTDRFRSVDGRSRSASPVPIRANEESRAMRSGSGPLGAPRLGLLTAAVALLALALFVAPGRRPDDGRQSTLWLAVESRALPEADATAAFASQFGAPPQGVDARRDGQPVIARPQR